MKGFRLLFLSLFYLILFEFGLRFFDPEEVLVKPFDSQVLFGFYPEKTAITVSEEYKFKTQTNSEGYRQTTLNPTSPQILLLGDSFSEGWGVDETETYAYLWNQKHPNDPIKNLAIHGGNPVLLYFHLRKALETYTPKEVWLQIFDNDLDDSWKFQNFVRVMATNSSDPSQSPKIQHFEIAKPMSVRILGETVYNHFKTSVLFRLGKRVFSFFQKKTEPILYYKPGKEPKTQILNHSEAIAKFGKNESIGDRIFEKYNGQFRFYKNPESLENQDLFAIEKKFLESIHDMVSQKKLKLRILYIPAKEFFAPKGILGTEKEYSQKNFLEKNPHHQLLKQFCEGKKLDCIFSSAEFFYKTPEDLYFPYDAHWNAKGHQEFAKVLEEKIKP